MRLRVSSGCRAHLTSYSGSGTFGPLAGRRAWKRRNDTVAGPFTSVAAVRDMTSAELTTTPRAIIEATGVLQKRILAARIRADLAEKRITRKELARWTERSAKTVERWTSDAPKNEKYRPTRSEAIVLALLTGYPVSRYTDDHDDDDLLGLIGPEHRRSSPATHEKADTR